MFKLTEISRKHPRLLRDMAAHYSQPKGLVGRTICYGVSFDNVYYGAIVAGSATKHLPGREAFLGLGPTNRILNNIINNTFFHIERQNGKYPMRNFLLEIIKEFRAASVYHWQERYGDQVLAFESLVELPRTGDIYLRDGWTEVGQTKGFTCKREGGVGTDRWTGARVWNTIELRPKKVFMRRVITPNS